MSHLRSRGSFQPRQDVPDDSKANTTTTLSRSNTSTNQMNRASFIGGNIQNSNNNNNNRRPSLSVPMSGSIFPSSAEDRHESIKLTKEMEEKYGFHYFTNTFCENRLMEIDYRAYFIETNINPACYASLFSWFLWILISIQDAYSIFSKNENEKIVATRKLLISSIFIFFPVPILVSCCRAKKYHGKEQMFLCTIVHCFAFVILSGGAFPLMPAYRFFLMKDFMYLTSKDNLNLFQKLNDTISLNSTGFSTNNGENLWQFPSMINTTGAKVMDFYLEEIVLQIAHLNISLLRPLIVLILTPMFKLDPFHFVVTTFSMNIGFCILVAILYPQTNNIFLILNKFLLIFILVGISIVLCFRVRQTDRFLRFNFLYAKIVEEKTKASNLQKEFILKENTSLKKLLEETNLKNSFLKKNSSKEPLLDFDTPISKVILDLKNIQQTTSLSFSLKQNLDEIIQLLSKKSYNLFAPDIHEQLKQKREIDLDGDTKSWATTVLANKAYTRDHNRRVSNNIYSSTSGTGSTAMTGAISRTGSRTTSTSTTTTSTFINTGSLGTGTTAGTPLTSPTNSNTTHVVVPAIVPNESTSTSTMQYTNSRLHPDVLAPSEETLLAVSGMMRKDGWNVDIHLVSEMSNGKPLSYIAYVLFERHNLFTLCCIDKKTLANFLWFLDIGYLHNPYHDNCHAADVVCSVEYLVVDNCLIHDLLTTQEVFASFIAAAIHDFRHPGKTNNFMVKSGSDLAIEFSDSSVLERMHLAEAFFLTKDPLLNIFSQMAPIQFAEVRKAIIEMVLSTDLSVHLQLVGCLKTALISQDHSEIIHSPMMMMKIVIKCADLGHSSKTAFLHARWSDLIIEEFFLQGDEEAMLGMDISPFMNRHNENSAKNQVGFFEFIILPFFENVAEVAFRSSEFKTILHQAHQNYKLWKKAEALQLNSIQDILDQVFFVAENLSSPPSLMTNSNSSNANANANANANTNATTTTTTTTSSSTRHLLTHHRSSIAFQRGRSYNNSSNSINSIK